MPETPPLEPNRQFLKFVQERGSKLRAGDKPPRDLAAWDKEREALRKRLLQAWGGVPAEPCPLEPQKLGELAGEGYRVEKLIFQTRPGVWMTANAYVPEGEGKRPAVLNVHGHWRGAKQDPVLQSRCIGLAKLGFFVLCVDAFGAGERGVSTALGEYHGEMTAATLFPVGLPLSGLQVYENMRAVDYLQSRPEVDGKKIGITGASGGGNQTMYAGAFDERFGCVVPVCSVGTYQSYLGAACCMCEVVPGALTFTAESGLLALVAPRALMVINATQDAFQFSVGEAQKSIAAAKPVFDLYERPAHLRHTVFESPHAYSQPMREAMYGWMTLHLKGEGEGDPIPEPKFETIDPELLRCFPGDTRPANYVTIPKFAAAEAERILENRSLPDHVEQWEGAAEGMRHSLKEKIFGGFPNRGRLNLKSATAGEGRILVFQPEPGINLTAVYQPGARRAKRLAVFLDLAGAEHAAKHPLTEACWEAGWDVVRCDLRGTGALSPPGDLIGRAPDHNSAEWALWTGRPLLGQWTWDVMRLLDALLEDGRPSAAQATLVGLGPASLVALCAAAFDQQVRMVVAADGLASYRTELPYEKQWLGLMAPRILRDAGDVPHLAALAAPRPLIVAGGVTGNAEPVSNEDLAEGFAYTRQVYKLLKAGERCRVIGEPSVAETLRQMEAAADA